MMITKNLSYAEVIRSETAKKHGIKNEPDARQLEVIRHLAINLFQPVRDHFNKPLRVTSLFRNKKVNQLVGGSSKSDHMVSGDIAAVDIDNDELEIYGNPGNDDIFWYIYHNMKYSLLIWEFGTNKKPAWVHISFSLHDSDNEKKRTLRAVKGVTGTTIYRQFNPNEMK